VPDLTAPTPRLHAPWLAARDEWGLRVHQDGSGLAPGQEVDDPAAFAAWCAALVRQSDPTVPPPPERVHATYWWITQDDEVLGAISLRHELNDFLMRAGGHIGYGVRPSARRRGLATWALGQVLPHAVRLGLPRVLITCEDTNVGSARTIERRGGVFEDVRETELGRTRRYWITLPPQTPEEAP
jgi:predicted acetyltransferase